jgi:hypothetical protein
MYCNLLLLSPRLADVSSSAGRQIYVRGCHFRGNDVSLGEPPKRKHEILELFFNFL